jgi:hypothetical protein
MARRKGEITSWKIDAWWPYQIALRESVTVGKAHDAVREFCNDLSLAPRGHTFRHDDEWWNVWCFAEEEDAQKFQAKFGGEFMEPENRPRWGGKERKRR